MKNGFIRVISAGCAALIASFLFSPAYCQQKIEKRVTGLEHRVGKVEKRVTRLESGRTVSAPEKMPASPIAAVFLKKEQVINRSVVGLKLFLELKNITNLRLESFSGKLVFMDGAGNLIYTKQYYREEALEGGEKITIAVTVPVSDSRMKTYLKLLRAKIIAADFTDQKFYAPEN